jgi:hypothetical protein
MRSHRPTHDPDGCPRPEAPGASRRLPRSLRALLPALLAAALVGSFAGESSARERSAREHCSTKPAVCARLKATRNARATTPVQTATPRATEPVTLASASSRCTTKPAVCARLAQREPRPRAASPIFVAQASPAARCASKPAVCARLKMRESQAAVTLAAGDAPSATD